ncbi:50S ribosomal protein L9, partial [Candidatus Dependentiae bacterium]
MKVFLRKDVEKIGLAGEIVKVTDGYAKNYLIPKGLAVVITGKSEKFFKSCERVVENRKSVITTQSSMLAEKINSMHITIKRKMHDDGKLYGAINPNEIVDELTKKGVSISKNQVLFPKSIKERGTYEVTIKLSSRLQPK